MLGLLGRGMADAVEENRVRQGMCTLVVPATKVVSILALYFPTGECLTLHGADRPLRKNPIRCWFFGPPSNARWSGVPQRGEVCPRGRSRGGTISKERTSTSAGQ